MTLCAMRDSQRLWHPSGETFLNAEASAIPYLCHTAVLHALVAAANVSPEIAYDFVCGLLQGLLGPQGV